MWHYYIFHPPYLNHIGLQLSFPAKSIYMHIVTLYMKSVHATTTGQTLVRCAAANLTYTTCLQPSILCHYLIYFAYFINSAENKFGRERTGEFVSYWRHERPEKGVGSQR